MGIKTLAGGVFGFMLIIQITFAAAICTGAVLGCIWLAHHLGH